jgi:hypothetical protein
MKLYVWNYQGIALPGFPLNVGSEIRAPVAVTDTLQPRIVLLTGDHRLFLINADGSIVPNFPVVFGPSSFYAVSQPIVADFDRDSVMEIAVIAGGEHDYKLYIVEQDGRVVFQSQIQVQHPFVGQPAAADINNDGYLDIVAASRHKIYAFNPNGTLVTNYPFVRESTYTVQELAGNWIITYDVPFNYLSSPVIADLNNDGIFDLIIGSPQYGILGYDGRTGKLLPFFPLQTTAPVSAVPLVADIDNDGVIEIVVGSDQGVFYAYKIPHSANKAVWSCANYDPCHTGFVPLSHLTGFPPTSENPVQSFYVYPNPAGGRVTIRYRLGSNYNKVWLMLLDMRGNPVIDEFEGQAVPLLDNEIPVDLRNVPPGLYVVRLRIDNGNRDIIRFAKLAVVR